MTLVLASASPRRSQILAGLGVEFAVEVSSFDEASLHGLGPRSHAFAAARGKSEDVHRRRPRDWVVGADTVVAMDGRVMGKPRGALDAARMLRLLAGRSHSVISALHVCSPRGPAAGFAISRVRLSRLSSREIEAYVAGGEPDDKAGAYGIQGAGGRFARLQRGRLDTVVGLPTHLLWRLLRQAEYPDFANLGPLP